MIVIVIGLPGSGKSYFATRLAAELSAGYINSDRERKNMLTKRTYTPGEKLLVYDKMLLCMKSVLKENKDLVLDATFFKQNLRKKFIEAAGDMTNIVFIEIIAGEELTKQRLGKEREDSEADFNVYEIIKSQWEPLVTEHLTLESTDENINEMILMAVEYIKTSRQ